MLCIHTYSYTCEYDLCIEGGVYLLHDEMLKCGK